MKRNNLVFYIFMISLAIFYALTCGFAATSVKAPKTAYSTVEVSTSDGSAVSAPDTCNVTLDIANGINKGVNKIYAYIGEIRSFKTDDTGEYVNLVFDFKYRSDRYADADTTYSVRVGDDKEERIYLSHGSGGYRWKLLYDGGENSLNYDRVRMFTSDEMDIYEVAFVDKGGNVLKTSVYAHSSLKGESGYENVCDESSAFTPSSSKAKNFTDKELDEIAGVNTVMRNSGKTFGTGVLNAEINAISAAIFGLNTFALRFPSILFGFALIIAIYLIADILFGNSYLSLFAALVAFFAGNIFAASLTASITLAACLAAYAFYFAIKFFACDYYIEDKKSAGFNVGLSGLFYGLAVSAKGSYVMLIIGLAFILVMAAIRGAKKFKADEKRAKGLEKEDVFLAYRSKKIFFGITVAAAYVVLPILLLFLSGLFVDDALVNIYPGSLAAAIFKNMGHSFGFSPEIIPIKSLIGLGSDNLGNGYYAFANYFVSALCVVSLLFVIIAFAFRNKNDKLFAAADGSVNKTKILLSAFAACFITMIFGAGYAVIDFALSSAFYALIAALALSMAVKAFGEKIKKAAFIVLCVCFVAFAMGYVGYTGIPVHEIAKSILYGWQI